MSFVVLYHTFFPKEPKLSGRLEGLPPSDAVGGQNKTLWPLSGCGCQLKSARTFNKHVLLENALKDLVLVFEKQNAVSESYLFLLRAAGEQI